LTTSQPELAKTAVEAVVALAPPSAGPNSQTIAEAADGGGARKVVRLSVAKLRPGPEVRFGGVDERHAMLLATSPGSLPPIVVNSITMAVIDGSHRVRAAQLRGDAHIEAVMVEGSEMEMFVAAVRANVEHGKPLTLEERQAAAVKLLRSAPLLSDRSIGDTCGLSHTTIGKIRRATGQDGQLTKRVGRDGRIRSTRVDSSTSAGVVRSSVTLEHAGGRPEGSLEGLPSVDLNRPQVRTRRPSSGRQPGSRERNNGIVRPLLLDEAFRATPALESFAAWFDSKNVNAAEIEIDLSKLPRSRLYELSDQSRVRSEFWRDMAARLAAIGRDDRSR
jgi:hypothetical protein